MDDQDWIDKEFDIPKFPEKYLRRRSIAQPILKRTTTLGELVSQLESIAEVIETQDLLLMKRKRNKKYSDRALISQVKSLAHREKLPETTKALGKFIEGWEKALQWTDFEYIVNKWQAVVKSDLDNSVISCEESIINYLSRSHSLEDLLPLLKKKARFPNGTKCRLRPPAEDNHNRFVRERVFAFVEIAAGGSLQRRTLLVFKKR